MTSATLAPAAAEAHAIRLAREIVDLDQAVRRWRTVQTFGDELVTALHVRGDQRWRDLCDHLTRGIVELCRIEGRLKQRQAEFIELMTSRDLLIRTRK